MTVPAASWTAAASEPTVEMVPVCTLMVDTESSESPARVDTSEDGQAVAARHHRLTRHGHRKLPRLDAGFDGAGADSVHRPMRFVVFVCSSRPTGRATVTSTPPATRPPRSW